MIYSLNGHIGEFYAETTIPIGGDCSKKIVVFDEKVLLKNMSTRPTLLE